MVVPNVAAFCGITGYVCLHFWSRGLRALRLGIAVRHCDVSYNDPIGTTVMIGVGSRCQRLRERVSGSFSFAVTSAWQCDV